MKRKKLIPIKFLVEDPPFKKGEIVWASKTDAELKVKRYKTCEYVDEKRLEQAKYYRDKTVLETGKNFQLPKEIVEKVLKVNEENYDRVVEKKFALQDVHNSYEKHLHLEDTDRIDIVLAVALSTRLPGIPLWLIIVGPSGDMKSVQMNSLEGFSTFYIQKITSKTLVNGFQDKTKHPDLAPMLNDKLLVIRDMATLMKLPPSEKAEIWGQLRDLYDGFASTASGMGTFKSYKDIKVTLIAASTPAIDGQILIHQDLGTREMIYRVNSNKKKDDLMNKCMDNERLEKEISKELNEVTLGFLNNCKITKKEVSDEISHELKKVASYLTHMRATASIDSYTNTLTCDVYPEEPTRIIKQLKRLFVSLLSLDKNYPEKKAIKIIWHLARSSAFQNRVKILDIFFSNEKEQFSTSSIADRLKIGKGTAQRELNILWNMRFIECERKNVAYADRTYDYWTLNINNPRLLKLKETVIRYMR